MSSLNHCYRLLSAIVPNPEPIGVVECVERHRAFWRPERVHTVLLAESHVYTPEHECVLMKGDPVTNQKKLPEQFVRLVYCLGYGEADFVGQPLPGNAGTWQYWKLFSSCFLEPKQEAFARVLKHGNPRFSDRLRAKVDLLERLQDAGVWLLDASILALYQPGGRRLHESDYAEVLRCCWRNYVGPLLSEAGPHSVVVIGRRVAATLHSELRNVGATVITEIPQPQARMSRAQLDAMHWSVFRACQRASCTDQ